MVVVDESYDQVKTSILTVLAAIELCRVLSLIKKYIKLTSNFRLFPRALSSRKNNFV